jgi:hypothetical protein
MLLLSNIKISSKLGGFFSSPTLRFEMVQFCPVSLGKPSRSEAGNVRLTSHLIHEHGWPSKNVKGTTDAL